MGTIISEITKLRSILNLGRREKGENRTEWDFEFWCQPDGLSDLRYTTRSFVLSDAVEMDGGWVLEEALR